jgi:hypothetical protein
MNNPTYPIIIYPQNIRNKVKAQLTLNSFDERVQRSTLATKRDRIDDSALVSMNRPIAISLSGVAIALFLKVFSFVENDGILFALGILGFTAGWIDLTRQEKQLKFKRNKKRDSLIINDEKSFFSEPINWSDSAKELVTSTKKRLSRPGLIEDHFAKYLALFPGKRNFGNLHKGQDYQYEPDLELILPCGLGILIEIDEPYDPDGSPCHCYDDRADSIVNEFFTGRGWIIIRFSERQVVTNPKGCCGIIAEVVIELTQDSKLHHIANDAKSLKLDSCWSLAKSRKMFQTEFRQKYLRAGGFNSTLTQAIK